MINKKSSFWMLVEKFRALPLGEPIGDLLLIFAWQHLLERDPQGRLPKLADVIEGRLTLGTAFQRINDYLGKSYHTFGLATFSEFISPADNKMICQTVTELADLDKFDLVKTCFHLKQQNQFNREPIAFETDLLELLVDLAHADSREILVPYDRTLQLAILCAEKGFRVFYSHAKFEAFTEAADIILGLCNENQDSENDHKHLFGDAPLIESDRKYSKIVLIPPFGAKTEVERKKINSEVVLIENALAKCTGSLIALVPQGVMFRGGESSELRRDLVIRKVLKSVIQLPPGIVRGSSIALSILVLQKNTESLPRSVRFIDAERGKYFATISRGGPVTLQNADELVDIALHQTNEKKRYWRDVNFQEIAENHFDLSVSKFVLGRASVEIAKLEDVMPLEAIATLVRGQLLKEETGRNRPVKKFYEVGVRDLGEAGYISKPAKSLELGEGMIDQAEKQKLLPGDILLVSKGSAGKVGLVGPECGDNWVASQSFQIIRLKHTPKVTSPEYLFMFLSSSLMQEFFKEHVTGTTIPVLKTSDIRTLSVPIPPLLMQREVIHNHRAIVERWNSIKSLQSEIDELQNTCWGLDVPAENKKELKQI